MSVIRHFEADAGGTRRLSQDAPRRGRRADDDAEHRRGRGGRGRRQLSPGALRRDVGGRGPDPDHHRQRRGQAVVEPRLPGARARRPGRDGDGQGDARRRRSSRPSRSRWTTRSCSPPPPASRSACPVDGISFRSRGAGGVKVFNTAQGRRGRLGRLDRRRARSGRGRRDAADPGPTRAATRDPLRGRGDPDDVARSSIYDCIGPSSWVVSIHMARTIGMPEQDGSYTSLMRGHDHYEAHDRTSGRHAERGWSVRPIALDDCIAVAGSARN